MGMLKPIIWSATGAIGKERECLKVVTLEEREPGKSKRGHILWLLKIEERSAVVHLREGAIKPQREGL